MPSRLPGHPAAAACTLHRTRRETRLGSTCPPPSPHSLPDSYLRSKGAPAAAAAAGVAQRSGAHAIVPPRFFVPLGAPQSALPFQDMDGEEAYLCRCFAGASLLERYVEWVPANSEPGGATIS